MFGHQFYPTTKELIKKMIEPYLKDSSGYGININANKVLDPSAGDGAILDYIKEESWHYNTPDLFAIEIDPTLQEIVKNKATLIGSDFLEYEGDTLFDLIIMNPPFDNGAKHLLKAWDVLYKGHIACLLNAETILNPYTQNRKILLEIIEKHGSYEILGNVFSNARHETDVNVALVRLEKTVNNMFDFEFDLKGKDTVPGDLNENTIKTDELATNDIIGSTVIQYEQLRNSYVDYIRAVRKLEYYSNGLLSKYTHIEKIASESYDENSNENSYNEFTERIKAMAWHVVLNKSGIEKYMTTKVRNNFQSYIQETGKTPFTKENIFSIIRMVVQNADMILEQAIVDAFDMLTNYSENKFIIEEWKTNDKWKVNKKVIIPYYITMSWDKPAERIAYGSEFKLAYSHSVNFSDVDKALCYITGKKYGAIDTVEGVLHNKFREIGKVFKGPFPKWECESEFFKLRFYLRGTIHVTFKDHKLWEEFNIRATKLKNWLPHKEYDEWKAKRNGETRAPKSHRIEQTTLF